MNIKRLLYSNSGRTLISILLGVGLASLFQKVCKDKDCLIFTGPVITDVDGKTFKHGDNCYKYDITTTSCDSSKKIIETSKQIGSTTQKMGILENIKGIFNF
jgi:hypothetical protein